MRRKCTEELLHWKKRSDRKPLIVRGSRQTGKTWLLQDFGSRHYKQTAYINLQTDRPVVDYLSAPRETGEILLFLESYTGVPFVSQHTLLILDNLQCAPSALSFLSSLALENPLVTASCDIIAAERGFSLSYDSCDAEALTLYPMDFEEFLWANAEFSLSKEIRSHFLSKTPLGKDLHQKALSQFWLYLAIGGMPCAVLKYREEKKLLLVPDAQQKILDLYVADFISQAPHAVSSRGIRCWQAVPPQAGQKNCRFQYSRISQGGTARLYQDPLKWLTVFGMALRSFRCSPQFSPTDAASFRLYLPDSGLNACMLGLPPYLFLSGEETAGTRSCLETCLAGLFTRNGYRLSYWTSTNQAEIPFLLEKNNRLTAVCYRMTPHQKNRSLARLKELCNVDQMYLLSAEDFKHHEHYEIIPFYAAFCI